MNDVIFEIDIKELLSNTENPWHIGLYIIYHIHIKCLNKEYTNFFFTKFKK